MDPLGPVFRGKVPVKGEWADASHEETPFIAETKKILKSYSDSARLEVTPIVDEARVMAEDYYKGSPLKALLEGRGWRYQRFTSFLSSLFRKRKLIFLSTENSGEKGLKLEVVMARGKVSHYYLLRWLEEWYDVYNEETEVR